MAYTVTLKSGLTNVCLPNGRLYQAGDVVILTDEQFGAMSATTRTALFSAATIIAVPAS